MRTLREVGNYFVCVIPAGNTGVQLQGRVPKNVKDAARDLSCQGFHVKTGSLARSSQSWFLQHRKKVK